MGLGPCETLYLEELREPGVALRRYEGGAPDGPLVLIVPAPIKRPYIWDLLPQVSAVRRCLEAGARVALVDWQPPPPGFGLDDYAERLLLRCLHATGADDAVLLGHSLGGLFAAIFAALNPELVRGLVLLTAPLCLGAAAPVLAAMARRLADEDLPEALPGSFIGAASLAAAPAVFGAQRMIDALSSAGDPERLRTYWLVERWALDEFALPRRLVAELAQMAREDDFVGCRLEVNGQRVEPAGVTAPLLCVLDPRCPLVPPAAVLPFVEAAASRDKTVLHYQGDVGVALQHVGPLVGRRAHALLWPRITEWIGALAAPAARADARAPQTLAR